MATRQIPAVAALSLLTRPNIDKFKLDLEALRRASDQTPRQVFMTEACQRMLTMQLYASEKIAKRQPELWQAWDDRAFIEVLHEKFPSDVCVCRVCRTRRSGTGYPVRHDHR